MSTTARRLELAALFSSLRRVAPTVPFWRLAAHRIPTLWHLYRGLLRSTSGHENINCHLRCLFRSSHRRHLTSPQKTKTQLERAYRWLDIFRKAQNGDARCQKIMDRYDHLLAIRTEKENWNRIFREEMEWSHKMRHRAILTGTIVRPTIFNKPFPRMKPQPIHVSRMINKRRKAREHRGERQDLLFAYKDYINHEQTFEYNLSRHVQQRGCSFDPLFYSVVHQWLEPLNAELKRLQVSYDLDEARSKTLPSPQLIAQVKEARREKIRNKTRERRREQKGEILNCTIERMRKGPPAHVLSLMTREQRKMDKLIRSPSEAGYTGMLKRRAGFKLKDDFSWRLEDGLPEIQEKLELMEREYAALQEENKRKSQDEISER